MVNLAVLAGLVRAVIRADGPLRARTSRLASVKFPILYGGLFALLHFAHVKPVAFLAGFTSMLIALLAFGLVTRSGANASNKRPERAERHTTASHDDAR